MLVPKELVAWWVKHHSLRLHVLFNRKNNDNREDLPNLEILRLLCICQADGDLGGEDLIKEGIEKRIDPDRMIRKYLAENNGILQKNDPQVLQKL